MNLGQIHWLISQSGVGSVIAGAKYADQVSDNKASTDVSFGVEQLNAISDLTKDRITTD